MPLKWKKIKKIFFILLTLLFYNTSSFAYTVGGYARLPKVKGRTGEWLELYEWYVFIFPNGTIGTTVIGQADRTGDLGEPHGHTGYYQFENIPAGEYSIMVTQPQFFARPQVFPHIRVSGDLQKDLILNADYCMFHTRWDSYGGTEISQTFVAESKFINRVCTKLAGAKDCNNIPPIAVSIHQGGINGPQIGPTRTLNGACQSDRCVCWLGDEVQLSPGNTYAVKLRIPNPEPGDWFVPYYALGDVYSQGQAYQGSTPLNDDWYIYIGGDSGDNTIISYGRTKNLGALELPAGVWWNGVGQTFRAKGNAIAGIDFFPTKGQWQEITVEVCVREGSYAGRIVAPKKSVRSASDLPFAVCWNPEESNLIPGNVYFVEITPGEGETGLNIYVRKDDDPYPYGEAYAKLGDNWSIWEGKDLDLTIIEYIAESQQDTGILEGTIKAANTNTPIPDARVQLLQNGVEKYSFASNSEGYYYCVIPVGTYDVVVSKSGYVSETRSNISIAKDQRRTENFTLQQSDGSDNTPPPAPTLLSPANNATVTSLPINFDWSDVNDNQTGGSNPCTYQIQVGNDSNFSSPVVDQSGLSSSNYSISSLPNGTYYWRVRVKDAANNYSSWTQVFTFTLQSGGGGGDTTPPPAPTLLSPANNATITSLPIVFDWTDVDDNQTGGSNPCTYRLQVDNDSDFSSPNIDQSDLSSSGYSIISLSNGTYYWRVCVKDAVGNTNCTLPQMFTLISQPVDMIECKPNLVTKKENKVTLEYQSSSLGEIYIRIYDVSGKLVREFIEAKRSGKLVWNMKDETTGEEVSSGIYLVHYITPGTQIVKRIIYVK